MNPTRTGLFTALQADGRRHHRATIARIVGGEPVADLRVRHAALTAIDVPADLAPSMIDEYPGAVRRRRASPRAAPSRAARTNCASRNRIGSRRWRRRSARCGVAVEEFDDGLAIIGHRRRADRRRRTDRLETRPPHRDEHGGGWTCRARAASRSTTSRRSRPAIPIFFDTLDALTQ